MPYPLPSGGLGGGRGNFTLKLASQSECPFVRRRAAKTAIDDRMGLPCVPGHLWSFWSYAAEWAPGL
jgi:hypothetical protein